MNLLPPILPAEGVVLATHGLETSVSEDWGQLYDTDTRQFQISWAGPRDKPVALLSSVAVAPETIEREQAIIRLFDRLNTASHYRSTVRNCSYGSLLPLWVTT